MCRTICFFIVLYVTRSVKTVFNGETVTISHRPYQVALNYDWLWMAFHQCGGVIISPKYTITAGHCFDTERDYYVRAGSEKSTNLGVIYQIAATYKHPNYTAKPYTNDLALLELKEEVKFMETIKAIKMAWINRNFYNQTANASGYGRTCLTCSVSETLLLATLSTISMEDCRSAWGKTKILDSMICAIDQRKSKSTICRGDSGGPVTIIDRFWKDPVLVGVVSYGDDCIPANPAIFSFIPAFRGWIKNVTGH
ncbi:trypsin-7-like [Bradysia coprophila]|uniref:trypsin-7-like n=1 Tax=Bradysia coprophila TaxID=38358 RepID=UPI00187DB45B|nr:trypsin-7-like [Bradysia coprophila]